MPGTALTIIGEVAERARRLISHRLSLSWLDDTFRTANEKSTVSLKVQVQL